MQDDAPISRFRRIARMAAVALGPDGVWLAAAIDRYDAGAPSATVTAATSPGISK